MTGFSRSLACLVLLAPLGCATLSSSSLPIVGKARSLKIERTLSMARLMEHHAKYDEAHKLYQGILEKDPRHALANHRMGILAVRRGEHAEALDYFEQSRKNRSAPSSELLSDIGYTRYLLHELPEAETELRAALELNPQLGTARTNLALVLAEQERDDEALDEFKKTIDEADALANLAYVQTKLGRFDIAEKNYHRALLLNPKQRQAAEALIQFETVRNRGKLLMARLEKESTSSTEETVATTTDSQFQRGETQAADAESYSIPFSEADTIGIDSASSVSLTSFEWAEPGVLGKENVEEKEEEPLPPAIPTKEEAAESEFELLPFEVEAEEASSSEIDEPGISRL